MIIDQIVSALVGGAASLLSFLPEDSSPPTSHDLSGIVHGYAWLNSFLPVSEFLDLFALSLSVLSVLFGIYSVTWVLRRLHVLG